MFLFTPLCLTAIILVLCLILFIVKRNGAFWDVPCRALLRASLTMSLTLLARQVKVKIVGGASHDIIFGTCLMSNCFPWRSDLIQICWWGTDSHVFSRFEGRLDHGRCANDLLILRARSALHGRLTTRVSFLKMNNFTDATVYRFHFDPLRFNHLFCYHVTSWHMLHWVSWLFKCLLRRWWSTT